MHRIISALLFCISTTLAIAQPTKPLVLADGAPDRYTVVRGDTLWGLSAKYLKDPYRWPALWKMNTQEIKNPHWIYPGQVLVLDRSGGEPRLSFATDKTEKLSPREYIEPNNKAIPSIPPQDNFGQQPGLGSDPYNSYDMGGNPYTVNSQPDYGTTGTIPDETAYGLTAPKKAH